MRIYVSGKFDYIPVLSTINGIIRFKCLLGRPDAKTHTIATQILGVKLESPSWTRLARAIITLIPIVNLLTLPYDFFIYCRSYSPKKAQIVEFMEIMERLGVRDLNQAEIAKGSLELSYKIAHLEENEKQHALKAVARLEFLVYLYLDNNQISSIPAEIGLLSQLKLLWLADNRINSIPAEIGLLTRLEVLKISKNRISSIPGEIGQLTRLQWLDLSSNQISSIPAEIGQLSQLQSLLVSSNQISSVPAEIGQLSQLQSLLVSSNQISSIPAEIERLTRLQRLNLSYNQISSIPIEIGQLTGLQCLELRNNPSLRELSLSLGSLPGITFLDTDGTQIPGSTVEAILASCQQLRGRRAEISLPQKLKLWGEFAQLSAANRPTLQEIVLNDQETRSVDEWLFRLERSRDFRYAQKALAKKACLMLLGLRDPQWRELFFLQVNANLERCEDRGSMAFNEIYTAWAIHSMPTDAPLKEKLNLLVGVAKTLRLRKELASRIGDVAESVEIYLYYEIHLREQLKLVTAIENMAYSPIGIKADMDENKLVEDVNTHYIDELIEIPAFQALIQSDPGYQTLFAQQDEELRNRMDVLSEAAQTMKSEDYKMQMDGLMQQRNEMLTNAARAWLMQKLN